jgi:hypothetical protein
MFNENALACLNGDMAGRMRIAGIDLGKDRRSSEDIRAQLTIFSIDRPIRLNNMVDQVSEFAGKSRQ